jgi:Hexameric tyrosine-coordinated heme protein (HTHP)
MPGCAMSSSQCAKTRPSIATLIMALRTNSLATSQQLANREVSGPTQGTNVMPEIGLPSLLTESSQAGLELTTKTSSIAVKTTQPDAEVCARLPWPMRKDADSLTAASHGTVLNFQTVAIGL